MSRLTDAALDYYAHLISQGTSPAAAMTHATQRFGIPAGDLREADRQRHEFSLPEADEIMADYAALEATRRWIDG